MLRTAIVLALLLAGYASPLMLAFLAVGGLGVVESWAITAAGGERPILTGLYFFGILGAAAILISIPFAYYNQFVIEQKHGFNKQTRAGFVKDIIKGLVIGLVLGGVLLSLLLMIMQSTGVYWWCGRGLRSPVLAL